MWKDSIGNIVAIFQLNILRIVGFYVRHSDKEISVEKNALTSKSFLDEISKFRL